MKKFPKQVDLLVQLRSHGERFVDECRGSFNNGDREQLDKFRFCHLFPEETAKDIGHSAVARLVDVQPDEAQITALHTPVFSWNGSIREPVVANASNTLLNTSECFPPALSLLALDYIRQGYGEGDTIYDKFVRKTGALFYCEATPRDFQISAARDGVGFYFKDPEQPGVEVDDYLVGSTVFFSEMTSRTLPGLDIHDIAHHASQMGNYGDFYQWLASHATQELLSDPTKRRQKMLLHLVLLTTLEHSVVAADNGVQSFGCLNWQSPRKSAMAKGVSRRTEYKINDYAYGAQDFNQWSAIRAIASIYRGQVEAEETLKTKLNWMADMGYGMDSELLSIVRPFQSYDYSAYTLDSAHEATLRVPETPEELFNNCRQLIEAELDIEVNQDEQGIHEQQRYPTP